MQAQEFVENYIEDKKDYFSEISKKIWEYAELAYEEVQSANLLMQELEKEGFQVERGVSGIPTAFVGKWGTSGYKFGFLGEYDALDGLSQDPATSCKQAEDESAPGHGCGHNLLGVGSLAAAFACKNYLEVTGQPGQVYFFGCPAEEGSGGKTFMTRDGVFDDMDFVYTWHPSDRNQVRSTSSVSIVAADFSFQGTSAHAGSSPWLGRSALDAAEIMSTGANYLREHMLDQERIHYAYLDAGGTAANVVQDRAVVKYEARSPKIDDLKKLFARLVKCAKGAALMTETEVDYEITMVFADYVPNPALGRIADQALKLVGPPDWNQEDYDLAKGFFQSYDQTNQDHMTQAIEELYGKDRLEEKLACPLDDEIHDFIENLNVYTSGSSDIGNVSYVCPTIELNTASTCLGNTFHTWQTTGQVGSSIGYKSMLTVAKAMALGTLMTLDRPHIIQEAKDFVDELNNGEYTEPLPQGLMPDIPDHVLNLTSKDS